MSEGRARFRIRKGEIEIEYEGKSSEINAKYEEAFEWITTVTITPPKHEPPRKKKKIEREELEKKQDRRGGTRSNVVSRAIDELVSNGWLDEAKTTSEVLAELERRAIPGITINNVSESLRRRARSGVLDRIRGAGRQYSYLRRTA